ncbi:uncharacterized protein C05D11.1-like isoform X2 [Ptychodera flava]|uniref:uncharacterized protein C05D11.1-like isoform X2 n=1 Tax=Ptychodera flava TaxID=63121 RepID=UPI00396AA632
MLSRSGSLAGVEDESQIVSDTGVLDLLANRCLAQGTNAWTDTDHTCYTVTTAGCQGFLNLLPVFLDHVLYPTLTDASFVTEVHHINGDGEDAGVVYCEMQARENSGESRSHLEMLRAMYPGHCGYKSETGGIMKNLRESTTNVKVINYHRDFYRPDNLCLIITGQVKAEDIFKALEPIEEKIISKGDLPKYTRPWQSAVPPLDGAVCKVVPYSSDDETNGMVYMGWRGPKAKDLYMMSANSILLEYLTDTAVAPLQREFVELDDPYCSKVKYSIIENSESCFYMKLDNVPKVKLPLIKDKMISVLSNIANGTEAIDMKRMASIIHKQILESLNNMEERPHDTFAFIIIGDALYGDIQEDLEGRLNQVSDFKKLMKEPTEFWTTMLDEIYVKPTTVTIIGEPSKTLMKEMADAEKERVAKQQEELGENGLKEKEEGLEKATEQNEIEAPTEMVSSLDVPDTSSIHFHPIKRYSNLTANFKTCDAMDISKIPFTFQLDDIHSNFVKFYVTMDTSNLPPNLRPYLGLFVELILESPVLRDGKLIPHDEVITQLASDTLVVKASLGIDGARFRCGSYEQLAVLSMKVEMEKYSIGVKWLYELLYKTQFTKDRLKIISTKIVNDVARAKREGRNITSAIVKDLNFQKGSNHHSSNMIRQQKFLSNLVETLEFNHETIIKELNELRDFLTSPANVRVHMSTDLNKLSPLTSPLSPWMDHFVTSHKDNAEKHLAIGRKSSQLLVPFESSPTLGVIVGVGSVESSYFMQTIPCVDTYDHQDLPAIMVFMEYLCALEGPMWRQIRGLGLAYHYSMFCRPSEGLLYFLLYKCTHVVNAYKQAKEIVDGYLTGKTEFDPVQLESSVSSVVFEVIERETTVSDTSKESLLHYFRDTDQDYNRNLLQKLSKVSIEDLKAVGEKYFAPLFDPSKARCAVCCNPSKVDEIKEGFKGLSRDLTVMSSIDEGFP